MPIAARRHMIDQVHESVLKPADTERMDNMHDERRFTRFHVDCLELCT
jgi:hypothetical protein